MEIGESWRKSQFARISDMVKEPDCQNLRYGQRVSSSARTFSVVFSTWKYMNSQAVS